MSTDAHDRSFHDVANIEVAAFWQVALVGIEHGFEIFHRRRRISKLNALVWIALDWLCCNRALWHKSRRGYNRWLVNFGSLVFGLCFRSFAHAWRNGLNDRIFFVA